MSRATSTVLKLLLFLLSLTFIVGTIWAVTNALGTSIDVSIDNQSRMLCESAKKSGNVEWLEKCLNYYETGDVKYLRDQ